MTFSIVKFSIKDDKLKAISYYSAILLSIVHNVIRLRVIQLNVLAPTVNKFLRQHKSE
jgi:hypothetical protein